MTEQSIRDKELLFQLACMEILVDGDEFASVWYKHRDSSTSYGRLVMNNLRIIGKNLELYHLVESKEMPVDEEKYVDGGIYYCEFKDPCIFYEPEGIYLVYSEKGKMFYNSNKPYTGKDSDSKPFEVIGLVGHEGKYLV